jgi:4-amino-4-deoxychorismate lyase
MESTLRRGAGAPDLRLIETLGWDGAHFVRLDLHLARLAASAAQLGWACSPRDVCAALIATVGTAPARVRLTQDASGTLDVTLAAIPAKAALWQVALAADNLSSDDPWLAIKSTNRPAYDAARANLAAGQDEVIFQNERGEVCDGSITTVFFDAGDGLSTPPLTSGLLPGVLRAEMLAAGTVREAVLHASHLGRVQLWVGNSLRGLIPAVFVEQVRA